MKRDELVQAVAETYADALDLDDLVDYVYNDQLVLLDRGEDVDLIDFAVDLGILTNEEADEIEKKGWSK